MTYIPLNSIPGADDAITIPAIVGRLSRTGQVRPCWVNEAGGMTFQIDAGTVDDRYVKWLSPDSPLDPLEQEADRMANPPATDLLVVAHGDTCAPNTLLDAAGEPLAYVDLGSLGIADRWADIAVGTWSVDWNFGREYEDLYYEAYGIDPDRERIDFYRLAWDVC